MDNPNEILDVVDAHDKVIGQVARGRVHEEALRHRAVHIFVFNSEGDLFVQKRSPNKDEFPNVWTSSCGGHVDSGEDYVDAARRELKEELSIDVQDPFSLKFIFKHGPCEGTRWEFIELFRLVWDHDICCCPEEISEGRWISIAHLSDWITRKPAVFAPSFRLLWERAQAWLVS